MVSPIDLKDDDQFCLALEVQCAECGVHRMDFVSISGPDGVVRRDLPTCLSCECGHSGLYILNIRLARDNEVRYQCPECSGTMIRIARMGVTEHTLTQYRDGEFETTHFTRFDYFGKEKLKCLDCQHVWYRLPPRRDKVRELASKKSDGSSND